MLNESTSTVLVVEISVPVPVPLTVQELIIKYSKQYGVNTETALRVAKCESNYNPLAKHKVSSASGVFQIIKGTNEMINKKRGVNHDVFNAEQNIDNAMWLAKNVGWSQWVCK